MSFRSRLLVVFLTAVLLPMIVLSLMIRREMTGRLTAQYERRVEGLVAVIEEDISGSSNRIAASLAALREAILSDNRFRRAAVEGEQGERRYLIDYAGRAMSLTGLSVLQIQDGAGRIISSGHFRNEYDRLEPKLPRLLAGAQGGTALTGMRTPDGPLLALARVDSFTIGGSRFTLVGGDAVGAAFLERLARGTDLTVTLDLPGPGQEDLAGGTIVRELLVPYIDDERTGLSQAALRVSHDLAGLRALRRGIDLWFLAALAVAAVAAVILVAWLSARISRPLTALARKTADVDLERLDVDFGSDRHDEIGDLSRLLAAMTGRLRAGALRIRDAERRAAVGELARQVNPDIKNGLTPSRNVFRHLTEVLRDDPQHLPKVFDERRETLESSITYLENLASSYARLYPRTERRACDLSDIATRVAADMRGTGEIEIRTELAEGTVVLADPLALRRILENLVRNAIESIEPGIGTVTVSAAPVSGEDGGRAARISISDTGRGMTEEQRSRIFDDFYTTKERGTGLGLSIVRRLVIDLGGTIAVESGPGRGSRFVIDLPAGDGA